MTKKAGPAGFVNGGLAPCPKTANCVSTEQKNPNRRMPPINYEGLTLEEAKATLLSVLKTLPKTEVKIDEGPYIYAEARTYLFEFYHDVEFYFDEAKKVIHFRSASRLGFSDFGTNKRRMQAVVARFYRFADRLKASK